MNLPPQRPLGRRSSSPPKVSDRPPAPLAARQPSPRQPGQGGGTKVALAPQVVRILGGQWKRTPLTVLPAPGLRPTPSRVRETLFNWLGQDLSGWRCVDAFAGTGALGLEAASRGASEVVLLERNPALVATLRRTVAHLNATQVKVECTDALVALRRMAGGGWDVVFLDPPFLEGDNDRVFEQALQAAAQAVGPAGAVYLESPRPWSDAELATLGWVAARRGRAGAVHHSLLRALPGGSAAATDVTDATDATDGADEAAVNPAGA